MENNDLNLLITAFKGYRDLLSPIQENLKDFADTFVSIRDDIEKLNNAFDKDSKGNLEFIYKNLAKQAENAQDLSSKIDTFNKETGKYNTVFSKMVNSFEQFEKKMTALYDIEAKAEEQIAKLDTILEERKKGYNVKELEKNLDNYNNNVKKISEFINKDVAESIGHSSVKLDAIKSTNGELLDNLKAQNINLEKMIALYENTNSFLKNMVEKESVNEIYIYEVLDKWAEKRKVKIK